MKRAFVFQKIANSYRKQLRYETQKLEKQYNSYATVLPIPEGFIYPDTKSQNHRYLTVSPYIANLTLLGKEYPLNEQLFSVITQDKEERFIYQLYFEKPVEITDDFYYDVQRVFTGWFKKIIKEMPAQSRPFWTSFVLEIRVMSRSCRPAQVDTATIEIVDEERAAYERLF